MHQGSPPSLVLLDQMGMGLCPRQFWVGIGCVPRGVASQPCPGTHSLQGVQVVAAPGVAYMPTLEWGQGGWEDHEGEEWIPSVFGRHTPLVSEQ